MNFSRLHFVQITTTLHRIAIFTAIFFLSSQIASATPPPLETTPNPDDISRIELNTSVSKQSGSYNQSYPIVVPPGRTGLTPNISLDYSSQSSDYTSPVGYGWNINIPYIERINKTGLNKLFTANYFSSTMDGELVASGTTGYRPEIESGSFNTYSFTNGVWISYDKKGTKYTYGSTSSARLDNTASSSQVSRWYLSEILDTNGNKITFTYFKDAGQIYPDNIGYSFVGSNPLHKIVFERASTTARVSYRNGFQVETKYRISSINTYFDNSLVKNYKLEFTNQTSSKIPLLASIQETGLNESSASTTLPKSTFAYSSTSPTMSWLNNSQWASTTPHDLAWQYSRYPAGADNYYNRVSIQDMNGDAYPDWLYGDQVHLSDGQGWAASSSWSALPTNDWTLDFRLVDVNGDLLPDIVQSKDIIFDPQFSGYTNSQIRAVYINNGNGTWSTSTSMAANIPAPLYTQFWVYPSGISYSKAKVDFVDMNGDGLTDWLSEGAVYLNNGNGWSTSTAWSGLPTSFEKTAKLADINGDGLPDIVTSEQWAYAYIYNLPSVYYRNCQMNQGNGTWINDSECAASIPGDLVVRFQNYNTNPLVTYNYNDVYLTDMTGDGLPDWYEGGTVYPNTGRGWATSTAYGLPVSATDLIRNYRLEDVNGDQMLDYVYSHSVVYDTQFNPDIPTATYREVLINQGKKPWLLSTTTNIYGGTTTIAYKPSTELVSAVRMNPNNPFSLYTVASVKVDPGVGPKVETSYSHSGADYYTKASDPFTRKFAGFGAITEVTDLSNKTTLYHQGNGNQSGESGDDYAKIGRSYASQITEAGSGNLFESVVNLYATSTPAASSTYVRLATTTKRDFDGDADRKDSAVTYVNSLTNGNLLQQIEWGEVTANADGTFTDTGTDKRTTTYTYASNTVANIIGLPSSERLDNNSGVKVKESRYYYDTLALGLVNKGNLTRKEDWATTTTYVNTQSSYNSFGLKTQDLDPRGNATNYVYDSFNLYPATSTNALSQSIRYTYDYSSGKTKTTIDQNGFSHESVYDGLDRLIESKEPRGAAGALVSVETNTYNDTAGQASVLNQKNIDGTYVADKYTYLDRLGRVIQERQEAEIANDFVVSDLVYGLHGKLAKESLPYFSSGSNRTNATGQNSLYRSYSYDALGRTTGIGTVLGTTTKSYDQWLETITDTLGNQKKNQSDAYGRLASVQEVNGTSTYTTTYLWTPHNQLSRVTDALSNVRNFGYDGLGRRVRAEDLHASADTTFGVWTYAYDAAGNLGTTTNPKSQVTVVTYDALNRPLTENFTGQTGTEGRYQYDTCTNGKGYLCISNSLSATTTLQYNPAGLVSSEQKTIAGTNYLQTTTYNRQNSPVEITYPDASIVRYAYNVAGQLDRVEQKESSGTWRDIVSNYDYGPHGNATRIVYGNGAITLKTFDETELYRLKSLKTIATTTFGIGGPGMEFPSLEALLFADTTSLVTSEEVSTIEEPVIPSEATSTATVIPEQILEVGTTSESISTPEIPLPNMAEESLAKPIAVGSSSAQMVSPENYVTQAWETQLAPPMFASMSGPANGNSYTMIIQPNASSGKDTFWGTKYQEFGQPDWEYMMVGGNADWYYSYIEIPIADLPNADLITSVKLKLYNAATGLPNNNGLLERITQPWTEASVELINNPAVASSGLPWIPLPNMSWIQWDITNIVKDWKNGLYPNYGFKIKGQYNAGDYVKGFYTSENASSTLRPYFEAVVYSIPPLPPTELLTNNAANPTTSVATSTIFSAIYNDQNVTDTATAYQLQIATSSSFTGLVWDTLKTSLATQPLAGTRAPDITYTGSTTLSTTTEYFWRIKFWDTYDAEGEWSVEVASFILGTATSSGTTTATTTATSTTPTGWLVQDLTYTYDSVGNITSIIDRSIGGNAATTTYLYDNLYRLVRASTTEAEGNPFVETYAYNAVGNLTNKSNVGNYLYQGNTGSLYANPHAPTSVNGVTYSYDRNGNLATTSAGVTNVWDYRNRLTSTVNSGITTTYAYDINEQRVTKTVGGITTRYPSTRYEVAGATTTKHVYAGDSLLASITTTASSVPKTSYTHPDHLGSTHVITDDLGTSTNITTYRPYGAIHTATNTTAFIPQNQYIGQDRDQQADLSYLNARYYRANNGQFLSQDPVFLNVGNARNLQNLTKKEQTQILLDPSDLNSYAYARNNPLRYSDPNGLWFKEFLTGKQSYTDFKVEIGQATKYMTDQSPVWNYAVSNPGKAGAVVGLAAGGAIVSGNLAVTALGSSVVNVSGVGTRIVGNRIIEGGLYGYLAVDSLNNLPNWVTSASQVSRNNPGSLSRFAGSVVWEYGPQSLNPQAQAITDMIKIAQSIINKIKSPNSDQSQKTPK
jgi:RHS repeat-associated protein